MLQYQGNDTYKFTPLNGPAIFLTLEDVNHIAEESGNIEDSYVHTILRDKNFWNLAYTELRDDVRRIVN